MSSSSLARRERSALCDLALVLGEDAPTLSGDWDAKQLVCHLLLREYHPPAAAGLVLGPLSGITDHEMERLGRKSFTVLVEKLRKRGLTAYSLPLVDSVFNTLEYFVHHEDLRRAQAGWTSRALATEDQDRLWRRIRVAGKGLARPAGVPVVIRRTDTGDPGNAGDAGDSAILVGGSDAVTVSGRPSELVLFLFGRDQVRDLDFDGPDEAVTKVRASSFGI